MSLLDQLQQFRDDEDNPQVSLPSTGGGVAALASAPLAAAYGGAKGLLALGTGYPMQAARRIQGESTAAHTYTPRTAAGRAALAGLLDTSAHFVRKADDAAGTVLGVNPSAVASNVARSYPNASGFLGMAAPVAAVAAPAIGAAGDLVGGLADAAEARGMVPGPGAAPLGETLDGGAQSGRIGGRTYNSRQTVDNPLRNHAPGIYDAPADILARARIAPESPWLPRLFGVTRNDLTNTALSRTGNIDSSLAPATARMKPSVSAQGVTTDANAARMVDLLQAARDTPGLRDMLGWYVTDADEAKYIDHFGPTEGPRRFAEDQKAVATMSPMSSVPMELHRGTTALKMHNEGLLDTFVKHGGWSHANRLTAGQDVADALAGTDAVTAHPSQVVALQNLLLRGQDPSSIKVGRYAQSSGTPRTGFQTNSPTGDTHFATGVGLLDTRPLTAKGKIVTGSADEAEMRLIDPWFRKISQQVGVEPSPAQALGWGATAHDTGVDTPIGPPKLEMKADGIAAAAAKHGITPEEARTLLMERRIRLPAPREWKSLLESYK